MVMQDKKSDFIGLGIILLSAFLIRFFLINYQAYIENDGITYVAMAKQWVEGGGIPEGFYPPLYPLLVGLAHKMLTDYELSGRMVSVIFGTIVIIPLFLLCHQVYGRKVAFYTTIIASFYPALTENAVTVMTESTYICLIMFALYTIFMGFRSGKWKWFFWSGLFVAGVYYTRPEGLSYLSIFLFFGLLLIYRRIFPLRFVKGLALFAGVTLVAVIPYMIHIGGITKKEESALVYAQAVGKNDISRGVDEAVKEHYIQGKKGVESSLFKEFLNHPRRVTKRFFFNLFLFIKYVIPGLFPTLALMALAIGFIKINFFHREWKELFLLFSFLPVVVVFFFFVDYHRYFLFCVPVGLMFCAQGLEAIHERLNTKNWKYGLFRHITLIVLIVSLLPYTLRPVYRPNEKPYREAGKCLKAYVKGPIRLLDVNPQVAFYADVEHIYLPVGNYDEIFEYGIKKGATHIVIDQEAVLEKRPELAFLIFQRNGNSLLKRIAEFPYGVDKKLIIFKIINKQKF
jgi:4-amino-4-deoxy-L-arabinose transferase-like glycosyltransferase